MTFHKPSLKNKIYLTLLLLGLTVLLCWVIFFLRIKASIDETNRQLISQVSERVMDTLESTFLNIEHVSLALSASNEAKALIGEKQPLVYHEKAHALRSILDTIYQPDGLTDDILIYSIDGTFCRLRGELGNTAASRVYSLISPTTMPQHIAVTLEREPYIGYVTGVYQDEAPIGYLVCLMKSAQLQKLFSLYDASETLQIGLAANGELVAANHGQSGKAVDQVYTPDKTGSICKIGLTPFQAVVVDNGASLKATLQSFFLSAAITILLLIAMFLLFYRSMNRLFFGPMLSIIANARQIGTNTEQETLQPTGQEDFDLLITQINSMISRLEENSQTLYQMQYQMQNAEIDRQKAIVVSLKKQINAHFLVNTLNVIKRLNETGKNETAAEMCDGLAGLLRYANGAEEYIDALEEISVIQKYVDIMTIRYPGRFTVDYDIDDALDDIRLPRMLIQPLIENAITHGVLGCREAGTINIRAVAERGCLLVCVSDNGSGMSPSQLQKLRGRIASAGNTDWSDQGLSHIALPNIQKRVIAMFGEGYGLSINSSPGMGTAVALTLPILQIEN